MVPNGPLSKGECEETGEMGVTTEGVITEFAMALDTSSKGEVKVEEELTGMLRDCS